ncbi:hypothetical protein SAMN05444673_6769 [Bacillus sp. OV166]|uniref:CBO0543 family protein n=1 Tax=Bacillus sp. OV166 TaxID=1882763 RepID=UPI000A2ADC68|nr:CBO0543 family protein [Bacillus sp. OV166]SMQ86755.1 hypothetical protein SAMN05444673_6769 [Bacillus sp. OV166]
MNPTWGDVVKKREELSTLNLDYYLRHNLFNFDWWLILALTVFSYIIWCRFVDKKRIREILLFGLMIIAIADFIDVLGTGYMLWGYPNMIIPAVPPLYGVNYAFLPVTYSLIYQYTQNWKSFIIAMVIMAIVFAFIGEPLFIWLKIYDLHNWKSIYSFPLYIILGVIVKWTIDKVSFISKKQTS